MDVRNCGIWNCKILQTYDVIEAKLDLYSKHIKYMYVWFSLKHFYWLKNVLTVADIQNYVYDRRNVSRIFL